MFTKTALTLIALGMLTTLGCGPKYETIPIYTLPSGADERDCTTKAELEKIACQKEQHTGSSACVQQARLGAQAPFTQALNDWNGRKREYDACVASKQGSGSAPVAQSKNEQLATALGSIAQGFTNQGTDVRTGCTLPGREPRINDFLDTSHCQAGNSCLEQFHARFRGCGGEVTFETRCVANCGKEQAKTPVQQVRNTSPPKEAIPSVPSITGNASSLTRVTNTPEKEIYVAVSPDSRDLLINLDRNQNEDERSPDDLSVVQFRVTDSFVRSIATKAKHPAWFPDGRSFTYVSMNEQKKQQLVAMSTDNNATPFVVSLLPRIHFPTIDSERRKTFFAFLDTEEERVPVENVMIASVDIDGKNFTIYGKGTTPSSSPTRREIVFKRYIDKTGQLVLKDFANGGQETQLTNCNCNHRLPSFSPDGEWIAFYSDLDEKNGDIYVIHRNGTQLTRITNNATEDKAPYWARDGFIYFISNAGGQYDIWKVRPVLPLLAQPQQGTPPTYYQSTYPPQVAAPGVPQYQPAAPPTVATTAPQYTQGTPPAYSQTTTPLYPPTAQPSYGAAPQGYYQGAPPSQVAAPSAPLYPPTAPPSYETAPQGTSPGSYQPTVSSPGASSPDQTLWETINQSPNPEDFRAFLRFYPNSPWAPSAFQRLKELENAQVPQQVTIPPVTVSAVQPQPTTPPPLSAPPVSSEGTGRSEQTDSGPGMFGIKVYRGPGLNHPILTIIPPYKNFVVITKEPGWYKIRLDDEREGWIVDDNTHETVIGPTGVRR